MERNTMWYKYKFKFNDGLSFHFWKINYLEIVEIGFIGCQAGGIHSCKNSGKCGLNNKCVCEFGYTGQTCETCNLEFLYYWKNLNLF